MPERHLFMGFNLWDLETLQIQRLTKEARRERLIALMLIEFASEQPACLTNVNLFKTQLKQWHGGKSGQFDGLEPVDKLFKYTAKRITRQICKRKQL